jgi:large subunit ribosomal protein L23
MIEIIKKPVLSEKMTKLTDKLNRVAFVVDKAANKNQIKEAVEKMYDVTVKEVNTMVYQGDRKSRYTKKGVVSGRTVSFKKAIVTLAKGDNIDFFSNI